MAEMLTLALLGSLDPDPGAQPKKIMKGMNGAFVGKHAQQKTKEWKEFWFSEHGIPRKLKLWISQRIQI
jgi:hypothetical protein